MDLVVVLLVTIGSAIVAVLLTVWISSLVQAHRVRMEPTLDEARQVIVAALSGEMLQSNDALATLSRFSERYIVGVMLELAPSVAGSSRSVLAAFGGQIGAIDRARTGVHSRRWSTRLYSARVLTAFGVESTPAMYALLADRAPEVRAQAAAWCVAVPSPGGTERLIRLLADPDGQCRFAAQDALIRIGLPATEALVRALDVADDDTIDRILEIASASGDARYCSKAYALLADPFNVHRAMAVAALAGSGDRSAGPTLVALLDDPSDEVVLAAAAGLAKLAFWSEAAALEPLLSHPSWEIRRQAATTLLAFGAPGTILLQANAPGVGPAADIALHSLQLRSLTTQEEVA
jgi:plasmid stability protein